MNVILFGPDRPQISFQQDPSGTMEFTFENERVIYLEGEDAGILGKDLSDLDVLWADVYLSLLANRNLVDLEWGMVSDNPFKGREQFRGMLEDDLLPLLATDSERRFFDFSLISVETPVIQSMSSGTLRH